ncbi:hypothetical protein N44_03416 [Microcystis aeruginosa NIES-44]|uniref:Uncharacterized protein n=1 Tax=Microcystis aeruginosa NIES-44 TaxID=449439 RepID=A0A0A1VVP6_MICAE|nr:hypothetical protein N44_03416 [Microcystis aeruginosa NIES-44]
MIGVTRETSREKSVYLALFTEQNQGSLGFSLIADQSML